MFVTPSYLLACGPSPSVLLLFVREIENIRRRRRRCQVVDAMKRRRGKKRINRPWCCTKRGLAKKEDPVLGRNVTDLDKALEKCHGASTKNL